jgi:hypothetical protein
LGGLGADPDARHGPDMRRLTRVGALGIGPLAAIVEAPAELLYDMLTSIGSRRPNGERSTIIERRDDALLCDFWTLVPLPLGRGWLVRTREEVRLGAPGTILYRHVEGPLRDLREEISVAPLAPRRARLQYRATYRPGTWLQRIGFAFLRPLLERTMAAHFADLRERAEARAIRSRIYPPTCD